MEDEYATIELGGSEVWRVDIGEMLHRKLHHPLTEEIIEQLVQGVNAVISNKLKNPET